jgi:hypothetical protein
LQYLDYDFGVSTVGVATSQQYFTIENTGDSPVSFTSEAITGTNASDFTITSNNCPSPGNPLNALSTCYLYITFTPGASGVRTASLQYTDSATGSPQSTALAGVGLAPSQTLAFSSPTLIFTPVTVSTSGGQLDVEITNAGDQNVTFTGVNIIGTDAGDFSISSNGCASLTPATSCYVYVNYDPNTVGILSAALQLTDTATGSPQSIPLASDSESAGGVLSLTTLLMNFGGVNTSSSGTPIQVTVSNETGSTVTFSQAIVGQNASDYSVTSNTCTGSLINGANCAVSVNVTPSATGLRLGALEFTTGGIAQDVLLTAVGSSAATIVTLQSAYDFGKENVGTSSQQQLQLQNTGTENVTFTGTSITGTDPSDYTVAYSTCTVLAPGQTCTISVVFAPTAAGLRTAKTHHQ